MKTRFLIPLTIACLGLSACSSPSRMNEPAVEGLNVKGELAYLQRIALAPNSTARISIYAVPPADAQAREVWHHDMQLGNQQVPIPFAFPVDKKQLPVNEQYALRAVIHDAQGTMRWTTDTHIPIDAQGDVADVGRVLLVQTSGTPTSAAIPNSFRAYGNEPGWNFTLHNNQADVVLDYGQTQFSIALPAPQSTYAGTHYRSNYNGAEFNIDILRTPCFDTMSGESFDHEVALTVNNMVYKGCGRYQ
ncbi:MAG TPA: YbaY family lipoprotein [Paenalcaligenes sp.]|nr:YbaY family lipoprotein [Paenalcaligenes sp.]